MPGVKKNNCWKQLRQAVVGSFYTAQHFSWIKDPAVRSSLQRLADEINEDIAVYRSVLEQQGCRVIQPVVMSPEEFEHVVNDQKSCPAPPLEPRDQYFVLHDQLFCVNKDACTEIDDCLRSRWPIIDLKADIQVAYDTGLAHNNKCQNPNSGIWYRREKYQELAGNDWPDFYCYVLGERSPLPHIRAEMESFQQSLIYDSEEFGPLQAPSVIPMGHKIVIDCNEYIDYSNLLQSYLSVPISFESINTTAAHSDGCFMLLGNQTIVGVDPLIDYSKHFPGYHLIPVDAALYGDLVQQHQVSADTRWWVEFDRGIDVLKSFVDQYMQSYIGRAYETMFDVNILSVNDNLVCVSNDNLEIRRALSKRGIDSIVVPWRHRFFVDGGLHCLTLDLERDDV